MVYFLWFYIHGKHIINASHPTITPHPIDCLTRGGHAHAHVQSFKGKVLGKKLRRQWSLEHCNIPKPTKIVINFHFSRIQDLTNESSQFRRPNPPSITTTRNCTRQMKYNSCDWLWWFTTITTTTTTFIEYSNPSQHQTRSFVSLWKNSDIIKCDRDNKAEVLH